jgi:hypothetical protein
MSGEQNSRKRKRLSSDMIDVKSPLSEAKKHSDLDGDSLSPK